MSRFVTTQVSVNSQIRVIKNVSFSLLLVTFSIKANFEKEYLSVVEIHLLKGF